MKSFPCYYLVREMNSNISLHRSIVLSHTNKDHSFLNVLRDRFVNAQETLNRSISSHLLRAMMMTFAGNNVARRKPDLGQPVAEIPGPGVIPKMYQFDVK